MASGDQRAPASEDLSGVGLRIGVVRARWNIEIVDRLAAGADRALSELGVGTVIQHSVPGAYEIPMGAKLLAESGWVDAVVAIGAVIRGETTHYELVSEGCAQGVQRVQLDTGVPVLLGVVTVENTDQALARSESAGGHNVGEQAAIGAVEMARLVQKIR